MAKAGLVDLRRRSDIHLARKIWHFCGVMIMVVIYSTVPEKVSYILLGILWVTAIPMDFLRLWNPKINDFSLKIFAPIMRQSEVQRVSGVTHLLLGVTFITLFFPQQVVTLSLLFLAILDPLASYFGIRFGKEKLLGNKTLQGTVGAFAVGFLIALGYFYALNLMVDRLILVSILAGMIGALSELIPIGKIDDNMSLPILSSFGLFILFYLFGGF